MPNDRLEYFYATLPVEVINSDDTDVRVLASNLAI